MSFDVLEVTQITISRPFANGLNKTLRGKLLVSI
jgi:hypothetical protein